MSSERPEEPHYRNTPSVLSPASPKPMHFPAPTNITVLEMQHDVGFNQTEAHMSDPAAHNTDIRENMWRDPNAKADQTEQEPQEGELGRAAEQSSLLSTGADDTTMIMMEPAGKSGVDLTQPQADNAIAVVTDESPPPNPSAPTESQPAMLSPSAGATHPLDGGAEGAVQMTTSQESSSDPSIPTAAGTSATIAHDDMSHAANNAPSTAHTFNPSSVDVQALLDSLRSASSAATAANTAPQAASIVATTDSRDIASQPHQPSYMSPTASTAGLSAPPSGLPPRPPPQEQPLIHPNYVHSQHIRDYHPHAAHPAFQPHVRTGSQGNATDPSSKSHVPPVQSPATADASVASPQQGLSQSSHSNATQPKHQQPHSQYATNFSSSASPTRVTAYNSSTHRAPSFGRPDVKMSEAGEIVDFDSVYRRSEERGEDRPWNTDIQNKYDEFLNEEKKYVSDAKWELLPKDSRLFVGNLSSDRITKRDIFHVFHIYGSIAQISIKPTYGFVQFLTAEACRRALYEEQGTLIRDKHIHLEISKPQKKRARSPTTQDTDRRQHDDRYDPGESRSRYHNRDGYDNHRDGHNYPSYRSPPPRGSRDRRDNRYRSRSPDYPRDGWRRSRSPPRDVDPTYDGLPLPKRAAKDVPDVQIIVLDNLDREFIRWVEAAFTSLQLRVDVLILSPKLDEEAVVTRQMVEGVTGVVKLTREHQQTGKMGVQIFGRNGTGNVSIVNYVDLAPDLLAKLVLREKDETATRNSQAQYQGYGGGYGGQQQAYGGGHQQQAYGAGYGDQQQAHGGGYGSQQQAYAGGYDGADPSKSSQQPSYGQPGPSSYNYGQQGSSASAGYNYAQPAAPPTNRFDPNNLGNLLAAAHSPFNAQQNPYGAPPPQPSTNHHYQQTPPTQQGGAQSGQQVDMGAILARLGGGSYQR